MSTEENPAPTSPDSGARAAWGTPLPHALPVDEQLEMPTQVEVRPHWPARKVIGAVVIAAVIVGGGTAVAIAATAPTPSSTQQPTAGGVSGGGTGGNTGRGGEYPAAGAVTNALHGDFVVQTNTGGYATDRLQTGKVTRVSSTAISLTSPDGYASSYVVTTSTLINRGQTKITEVKTGDTVTVLATLSGKTATATTLIDARRSSDAGTGLGPGGAGGTGSGAQGGMQPNNDPNGN